MNTFFILNLLLRLVHQFYSRGESQNVTYLQKNEKNMTRPYQFIVQYVGFKTDLNENDFIQRWTPFATNFKRAGIKTIDLYEIIHKDKLTYISRNIWDSETYFQNFPSGVAGSGGGGGISVIQFGGYWIGENDFEKPDEMQLIFTDDILPSGFNYRKRCSDNVRFENQIEFREKDSNFVPKIRSEIFNCKHLKTM